MSVERKKEIIASVRKIISSKGMKNLTIREIARDLQITEGALYRHFANKEEIINLLIDDIEETLIRKIQDAAQQSNDPIMKLKHIFASHLSYAEQRKGVTFIVINETVNLEDRKLQKKILTVIDNYLLQIQLILSDGIRTAQLQKSIDVTSASIAFFGMIQSLVTLWALNGFNQRLLKNNSQKIFHLFLHGLLTKDDYEFK